jgi:hypothetical protein
LLQSGDFRPSAFPNARQLTEERFPSKKSFNSCFETQKIPREPLDQRFPLPENAPELRLVILVDQFEEVFTLCGKNELREALVQNLLYTAKVSQGQTFVILTMRADFYAKCATNAELAAAFSDHNFLVGPMTDQERVPSAPNLSYEAVLEDPRQRKTNISQTCDPANPWIPKESHPPGDSRIQVRVLVRPVESLQEPIFHPSDGRAQLRHQPKASHPGRHKSKG